MLGSAFFMSFISYRMMWNGYEERAIGYVHFAFYAGMFLGAVKTEKVILRIGHIRAFAAFAGVFSATILSQGINESVFFWVLVRFIAGTSLAGIFVVVESWLLDKSTLANRGRVLSIYMIAYYISQSISQLLFDYLELITLQPFVVAAFFASLAVIPVCWTRTESPDLTEPDIHNVWGVFRTSPFGFTASILSGMILSALYSFGPNYAQEYSLSIAYFMSLLIAGGVILQWPAGKYSDRHDRRKVLIFLSLLIIPVCLYMQLYPTKSDVIYPLSFILGGLSFTLYPICIAQVTDRFHEKAFTSVAGVLLLAFALGSMAGPLIAPYFMVYMDLSALFLFIALCSGMIALFGLYTLFAKKPVPESEKGEYQLAPRVTPVAFEMDPRAEPK